MTCHINVADQEASCPGMSHPPLKRPLRTQGGLIGPEGIYIEGLGHVAPEEIVVSLALHPQHRISQLQQWIKRRRTKGVVHLDEPVPEPEGCTDLGEQEQ